MLPTVGDRILVSHSTTRWGASGRVVNVINPTAATPELVLDTNIDWTISAALIVLTGVNGEVSDPIVVTQGASPNRVVLANDSSVDLDISLLQDPSTFTMLSFTGSARNMVVSSISHQGGQIFNVEAVDYAHQVFNEAPLHLSLDNAGNAI